MGKAFRCPTILSIGGRSYIVGTRLIVRVLLLAIFLLAMVPYSQLESTPDNSGSDGFPLASLLIVIVGGVVFVYSTLLQVWRIENDQIAPGLYFFRKWYRVVRPLRTNPLQSGVDTKEIEVQSYPLRLEEVKGKVPLPLRLIGRHTLWQLVLDKNQNSPEIKLPMLCRFSLERAANFTGELSGIVGHQVPIMPLEKIASD